MILAPIKECTASGLVVNPTYATIRTVYRFYPWPARLSLQLKFRVLALADLKACSRNDIFFYQSSQRPREFDML